MKQKCNYNKQNNEKNVTTENPNPNKMQQQQIHTHNRTTQQTTTLDRITSLANTWLTLRLTPGC